MVYDKAGNLLSLTDPTNNTTTYTYDALNRLIKEAIQLNWQEKARLFEYDANGNRTKVTDRNGRVRTFEFDGPNRQTHERWIGVNNSVLRDVQSKYDVAKYDVANQLIEIH